MPSSKANSALSLCLLLLAILLSSSRSAVVFVSPTLGDDSTGEGTRGNPYATLHVASTQANSDDTIGMLSGAYQGKGNQDLGFEKNLTYLGVDGYGTAVVQLSPSSHFYFLDSPHFSLTRLTVDSLIIQGGNVGITALDYHYQVHVVNTLFQDVAYYGIENDQAKDLQLTLEGVTFESCGHGAVYTSSSRTQIVTASNITSTSSSWHINSGNITITDSIFLQSGMLFEFNTALIYFATIKDCTFEQGSEPAIRSEDHGTFSIVGCTFENVKTSAIYFTTDPYTQSFLTVHTCKFLSNGNGDEGAAVDGGAIHVAGSLSVTVEESTFQSNKARDGGAVYCSQGSATIFGSTFMGNAAAESGGAVECANGCSFVEYNNAYIGNTGKDSHCSCEGC